MRLPSLHFVLITASLFAAEWSPSLSMKLRTISEVIPSPDGKTVIWLETRAVIEAEKSEMLTHLYFARADGSGRRQLTQGDKGVNAPAWAADGKSIFFASDRSGKRNYFRLPVEGGEAEKLTDWKGVLGQYRSSPDSRFLAFAATEEDKEIEKRHKEKLDFRVIGEKPPRQALWVLDLKEAGAAAKVLLKGDFHVASFDWSPDGKTIAVERRNTSEPNEAYSADVLEVDVATGTSKQIAATSAFESDPMYSPDGRYIALQRRMKKSSHDAERIALYTRASGEIRELPATPNDNPQVAGWTPESKSLLVFEPKGTRSALYRLPIDGPLTNLYLPKVGLFAGVRMNDAGTHFGFPAQSLEKPVEAFLMPSGGEPVQVSSANARLELPVVAKSEVITWKGKDGLPIEGILTYPTGYKAGTKARSF